MLGEHHNQDDDSIDPLEASANTIHTISHVFSAAESVEIASLCKKGNYGRRDEVHAAIGLTQVNCNLPI